MDITIEPVKDVSALDGLLAESERDGWRHVRRLADEWEAGTNRFRRSGEVLLVARAGDMVVGVCGLNLDPFAADPAVGRVRRLYVLRAFRGRGIGRRLVDGVVSAARGRVRTLRVRTNTPEGARFFQALGFEPVTGIAECTHVRALPATAAGRILAPMRVLFTSSRAPATLELIRAFGQAGHTVHAADTFAPTIGGASRYVRRHHVVPSPRHDTEGFGRELRRIVEACRIDVLIPTCEEVFHVGRHHAALSDVTRVLCPPLEELDRWHNKHSFQLFADSRGVRTPRTLLVSNPDERDAVIDLIPRWVLKPAYSRFAARVVTRWGPHADRVPLTVCVPTPREPWLAQEYVEGEAECSYSVAHRGRLTAHCAYRTPHRLGGGAGVSFRAVEGEPTRRIVERLLEGTGYTGQISFDFLVCDGERWLLECNPRTTSAVHVMDPAALVRALMDADAPTYTEPPGRYQQLLPVVLSLGGIPRSLSDVVFRLGDPLPFVASLSQMWHFSRVAGRRRMSVVEATTEDIEYNGPGEPRSAVPGPSTVAPERARRC